MQGFRWRKDAPNSTASERLGGWPQRRALAAAMMLHAAIIACAMFDWRAPVAVPPPEPVLVRLVTASPPTPEAARPFPLEDGFSEAVSESVLPDAPSPPADDISKHETSSPPSPEPMRESTDHKPLPPPPRAKPVAHLPPKGRLSARTDQPKDRPRPASDPSMPGVAIYRVLVGANGDIRSITLAQSSGKSVLDEAGIEVVRNTVFEAQAQGQKAETTGSFEVTLHFSAAAP